MYPYKEYNNIERYSIDLKKSFVKQYNQNKLIILNEGKESQAFNILHKI